MTDEATIRALVTLLVEEWLPWHLDMRAKARRPFAIIDGRRLPDGAVIYHCPEAIR